jgi:hypothetical protein
MANTDRPFGFKPVKHLLGGSWSGKANVYYIPASDGDDMFKGDVVVSSGSADSTGKYPTVARASAGGNVRGVIIGFGEDPHVMIKPENPNRSYRPGDTAMYCLVVDDPFVIFEVQEDSAGGTALDADDVGETTDIVAGAGNTTTGLSGMEIDSTVGQAQCKLLRIVDREDNELGVYCKWEIIFVEHELLSSTGV